MRTWLVVGLVAALGCGDDDGTILPDAGEDAGTDASDAGTDSAPPECTWDGSEAEDIADPAPFTPRWAFEPWISKDISDRADTEGFVTGFIDRDIPVGALVIDSPWETHYNTLIPNEERYGDFEELVDWLHDRDVRIVLWTTQMVNSMSFDLESGGDVYRGPAPNFTEGRNCGFYVNDGQTYGWWKGRGAAVDFYNPQAVAWWRRQQDLVLDMGIDGWKLDFGESYIRDEPNTYAEVRAFDGTHTVEEYGHEYYADFLRYGVSKRGPEFVTMVRGFDVSYDIPERFYSRPEHAPVVWMGDNHRDYEGFVDALDHTFRSAEAGYVMVGWDIGGYLDVSEDDFITPIPFDQENFARWTGVSAFMPFFQLHGRANLEPWNIEPTAETTDLYRYWATLHSEMVPFWFSLAQEAYAGGENIIRPIGEEADWAGDWRFMAGDAILVAPPLQAGGVRDVELPEGTWFDWWDAATEIAGSQTLTGYDASPIDRVPVFVKQGAIIPMTVRGDVTGFSAGAVEGHVTVLVWPGDEETSFRLHDEADEGTTDITAMGGTVSLSRTAAPTILRVHTPLGTDEFVDNVQVNGTGAEEHATLTEFSSATSGYWEDGGFTWIKVDASTEATSVVVNIGRPE
ncbi:MAG: TIM-barrel domain-containing protein [Planctomycetota bacterium]